MSEELLQRGLLDNPEKIGKWNFYNIGATSIKSLKEYGIIQDVDYGTIENKKVDGIIVHNKTVIAVIENKKPSQLRTAKQKKKAIEQELEVAKKLTKLLIVTDTKDTTVWINALKGEKIKDENGQELKQVFNPKSQETRKLIEKIITSIDENNSNIKRKELINPTSLAKQIWQDIWSVSGATPENCLYTFVELFIFKYLSDLGVLQGIHSFDTLIKQYKTNTEDQVLEYYADIIRKRIKELFPFNPKDKTTIINGTIFVSKDDKAVRGYSTVFKKIINRFNDFGKLENIDYNFKSLLFESFLKESISKKNWGQFFTPLKVVKAIIKMVDIRENVVVCDPACGVGKFLLEIIISDLNRFYKIDNNNKVTSKVKLFGFDKGFDKDEQKTIILAKANMLIYFSDLIRENPGITNEFAKLFNETFLLKTNSILGTLSDPVNEVYDLILTNPPYVTSGSSNLKEEIRKSSLESHYTVNALGVEGLFLEWIIRALKPNGKAFVVIPDGILNRQNDKKLRKFILDECYIDAIISLPPKTFFTTIKKTYILAITKKNNKIDVQHEPVFSYLVSDIGETLDVYRFNTDENHLEDAVNLFNQFKGAKSFFKTTDKRCKIQSIEKFNPDLHWSIDRWWTKQEKIGLGIIEEKEKLSLVDFASLLGELSNTVNEYQEELKELGERKKNKPKLKKISITDSNYFDTFIGKRVVKRDLVTIKGDIPVYSANVYKPIGLLKKSNITDFNSNYVLWGIDGNFEFNVINKGVKFATTDHCGAIRIKSDKILPTYLLYQLTELKSFYGFDRSLRSSLKNMRNIKISIPVNKDGGIDIDYQKSIVNDYKLIQEIKSKIQEYQNKINNLIIDIAE